MSHSNSHEKKKEEEEEEEEGRRRRAWLIALASNPLILDTYVSLNMGYYKAKVIHACSSMFKT
jgi:hypothetical protein